MLHPKDVCRQQQLDPSPFRIRKPEQSEVPLPPKSEAMNHDQHHWEFRLSDMQGSGPRTFLVAGRIAAGDSVGDWPKGASFASCRKHPCRWYVTAPSCRKTWRADAARRYHPLAWVWSNSTRTSMPALASATSTPGSARRRSATTNLRLEPRDAGVIGVRHTRQQDRYVQTKFSVPARPCGTPEVAPTQGRIINGSGP